MSSTSRYVISFVTIVTAQVLLNVYCGFTPYLVLNLLPLAILSLPYGTNTTWSVVLAFLVGLAVDFISTGTLGLNSIALMPVALARRPILWLTASDFVSFPQSENPLTRLDTLKVALTALLSCTLFLAVFSVVETAGTRPFGFVVLRVLFSSAVDAALFVAVERLMFTNDLR